MSIVPFKRLIVFFALLLAGMAMLRIPHIAHGQESGLQALNPPSLPRAHGYSHVVIAPSGRLVSISPLDLSRVKLLELRHDLHAVFDGTDHHVGVVKSLRGPWTFQAVGYGKDRMPLAGEGPCSGFHGTRLASAQRWALIRLFCC